VTGGGGGSERERERASERERERAICCMYSGEIGAISKTDFIACNRCRSLFWLGEGSSFFSGEMKEMSCDG
jgi:hypothetical protein